jgi:hypothetical protein
MKYLIIAAALTGLLAFGARADSSACKRLANGKGAQDACKRPPRKVRPPEPASSLSAAETEALNRAHTRTLLDNIQVELSRQR